MNTLKEKYFLLSLLNMQIETATLSWLLRCHSEAASIRCSVHAIIQLTKGDKQINLYTI